MKHISSYRRLINYKGENVKFTEEKPGRRYANQVIDLWKP